MPVLVLLYLLQCFTGQVQFGLFLVRGLPTVLCPDLSIKQIRVSQTGILQQSTFDSASAEVCLKQNIGHCSFKSWCSVVCKWKVAKETQVSITTQVITRERVTTMSYFKEGLVVILVPAPIKASCLLQKSLQCSNLCREVSVRGFGLMEEIMLWMKWCMCLNSTYIFM